MVFHWSSNEDKSSLILQDFSLYSGRSQYGTDTKEVVEGLEDLEIRGLVESIQLTALLRLARILRRVPEKLGRLAVSQTPVKDHRRTLM